MSILNFVDHDQLDSLDDDPRRAFMELVNIAQRSLSKQLVGFDGNQEDQWNMMEEIRHSFMSVIIASAKRFGIEPFSSMEVPRINDQLNFRQFRADLDHYITQLVLDNREQSRRESVAFSPKSRDAIRSYIHALKKCVEDANIDDKKRESLLKRIDEIEAELEKRRTSVLLVAKLALEVMAIPGALWGSYDITTKLLTNLSKTVEDARETERLAQAVPAPRPIPALSPPREAPKKNLFPDDLDDDVPF